jgi:hypothetical protein
MYSFSASLLKDCIIWLSETSTLSKPKSLGAGDFVGMPVRKLLSISFNCSFSSLALAFASL